MAGLARRLNGRTAESKRLTQHHRAVLADARASVGFRAATKEMRYPIAAASASGAHLTDVDGNDYVDITMGFGALLLGHEPPAVTEAVREHLSHGLRFGARGADTGETAALLAELTGAERVAFATSGTEANSAAMRLARAATGRGKVVTFRGSYHGHIDALLGRPGRDLRTVPVSPGIAQSALADMLVLEYGDQHSLDVIAEQAGTIAAVLVEPVQARNPRLRPTDFVRALRELCTRHGIVLIFDEMLTGLRPHARGAQHYYGVGADLATYGKALGSGFPVGAVAGRADLLDAVDGGFWQYGDDSGPHSQTVFFGGTYQQHPLSMAAARAVLTHLLQEGPALQERLNARTDRLADQLNGFFEQEEFPLRLDHFGSMFRFTHRADLELLYHHLLLRGVHVWEWRTFYLSSAHTDADVEYVAEAVRDSLRELRDAGHLPRPATARTTSESRRGAPDFSISFFGDYPDDTPADTGRYDMVTATARFADERGFHAVWLPERHFHSFGGIFPNPSVLAAALAVQTRRIRLHAGSVVLPLHDPIRIAEEWAVVDNLSGGRVGLGFGTGWHANDFALAPGNYDDRREISLRHLAELQTLWGGGAVRRRNGAGDEIELRVHPRPVQPQPPMWLATTGRPESFEQAGGLGLNVLTNMMNQTVEQLAANVERYRAGRRGAGLDPQGGRVTVLLHTYLCGDHTQARAEALEPMLRYLRSSLMMRSAAQATGRGAAEVAAAGPEDLEAIFRHAYDRYCDRRALIGSPDTCAPLVERLHAAGVDEIAALVDFGLPAPRVEEGLRHLDALRRRVQQDKQASAGGKPVSAPATPAQQRVWLASQLCGPAAYNEIQAVRLSGPLNEDALRTALHGLGERHPGLRTVFRLEDDRLHQVVLGDSVPVEITGPDGRRPDDAIAEAVRRESHRPRDLARGPLFGARLLRLGTDDHALVLSAHHLVTDGHSARIVAADLAELYAAAAEGRPARFDRPAGSTVGSAPVPQDAGDLAWWRTHLGEQPPVLRLPTDRPRAGAVPGPGAAVSGWIAADRLSALRSWSAGQGVTLFATLLTAWRVVLRRFSGQDEFIVGSTFEARQEGDRDTVGYFASLLPLRAALHDGTPLRDAVRDARNVLLEATSHSGVDVDELLVTVNPDPGNLRPMTLVSMDLGVEALPAAEFTGLRSDPVDAGTESSPLEMALMAVHAGDRLRLRIRYDNALFDAETAGRYLSQLLLVLGAMADGEARTVGELPALTEQDDAQVRRLARLDDQLPPPGELGSLLPEENGPVVVDENGPRDVLAASRSVAAALRDLGVRRGQIVGVALPRGSDFLAAILGVVACGAAYLPLDPAQPAARLAAMAADAAPVAVVCDDDPPYAAGVPRVRVGADGPRAARTPVEPDDLLCLLYTSGSTGRPKGVRLEHGNLASTLTEFLGRLDIGSHDRLSWYSGTGFDAWHIEVWPAVAAGASLHVVPEQVRLDADALAAWLLRERITVAFLPTAMAERVLDRDWPADTSLRVLCTGGEQLHARPRRGTPFAVRNIYGPTECSVFCTWGPVAADEPGEPSLGRPNPGVRALVRDRTGRPLPAGAIGELHVGGPQVARGYRDEQFATVDGCRWYPTGDLVRWRNDGTLAFCGRTDDQVQIRGVRVEPAEVAASVRSLPGVRDARVVPDGDELACRVLAKSAVRDEAGQVRQWRELLGRQLPQPMVPRQWQIVAELPLTPNGKWERGDDHDDVLRVVRREWAAVLDLDEFPDDARFFDLGGHSLTAMTLLNRVRERFGAEYPITAFFQAPTPQDMAERLRAGR